MMRQDLKRSSGEEVEPPTLLVVEDDPDMLRLIYLELQEKYQVITAVNGREGMKKALETIPDLVITDVMMPLVDGIELCRQLKANVNTSHIPVVMLTAKTAMESRVEGFEAAADDYVTKPCNMLLLKTRIHNLLEMRRLLRENFKKQAAQPWCDPQTEDAESLDNKTFRTSLDRDFWDAACCVIEQNYQHPEFSVELLASDLDMSERSVQRKIKAITGLTPVQLIGEYRLKKAAARLHDPDGRVTDIAFQVGFGDLSHFYRLFKKQFGMSPARYRNQIP